MSRPARQTVLFLHPSAGSGGPDRVLLQLVAALDRDRWQAVVALPRRGSLVEELEALGATLEIGPVGLVRRGALPTRALGLALGLPRCLLFLRRLISKHRPSVVHSHTLDVAGGAIAAKLVGKSRHVWHLHRVLPAKGLAARWSARAAELLADTVVFSSNAAKASFERFQPTIGERSQTVHNCVDQNRVTGTPASRAALRSKLGVEDIHPLVLLIGPLEQRGGHRLLLEAASSLRYTHPDTRYLIVGDQSRAEPRFAKSLVQDIKRMELDGIVKRIPHQSDIAPIYAAADIVCIPSHRPDRIQSVALEALAAGKPVVAASHPGTDEYVRPDSNGLFFEAGDGNALISRLQILSGDGEKRTAMGVAAQELHTAEFLAARFKNEFDRIWSVSTSRDFSLPEIRAQIVHLSLGKANPERSNGVNSVIHHLADAQARAGLAVEYWGLTRDVDAPTPERSYGLRLFSRRKNPFRLPDELREAMDRLDTTAVVHLHGAFIPEIAVAASWLEKRRIPYVVTTHGAFSPAVLKRRALRKGAFLALFQKRVLRGARAVQALSAPERQSLEQFVSPELLRSIPNGFSPLAQAKPYVFADADRRPLVAYCGRLTSHTKGLDAILDGFARHVVNGGKATLWIIGDGPDRRSLESRAQELGVSRRVSFLGALYGEEKAARLLASDAFIHASRHEGMPTAVLEAGAAGLALAVTPGTNLDVDVRKSHAGYTMCETSADEVSRTFQLIEAEHAGGQLAQRGQNAAWMAATYFTWERIAALVSRDLYGLEVQVPEVPDLADPAAETPPDNALGRAG